MGAYHGHYGFLTFSHHKAIYRQADVVPTETLLRSPYSGAIKGFLDVHLSELAAHDRRGCRSEPKR